MEATADLLVVGAGLLGSATAFHYARSGEGRVLLYEGNAGRGASASSAGLLTVVGWDPWDLGLVLESAEELSRLSDETGLGRFARTGGLRIARTAEGAAWLERMATALDHAGLAHELLDPEGASRHWPTADFSDLARGLFTRDDATFESEEVLEAYRRAARRAGVAVVEGREPGALAPTTEGWVLTTPEGSVSAPRALVAVGAWSKSMLRALGVALPVAPFRTQAVELRPRPLSIAGPSLHDLDLQLYVRTAPRGRLVAGDGTELVEADPARADANADPEFPDRVRARLAGLFAAHAPLETERSWAGLCVASPDRYPLVGRVPHRAGLFVATGFNGFGAMRAPALARRLAWALTTDEWAPLAPADPGRFPDGLPPFAPRPEFPLEAEGSGAAGPTGAFRVAAPSPPDPSPETLSRRSLSSVGEIEALDLPPLSEWFDPFLGLFLRDALRTHGEAVVVEGDGRPLGVYLYSPSEGVGSVFTRCRAVAERFVPGVAPGGVYAEREWSPGAEGIEVLAADLRGWVAALPQRNPVRIAGREDLPALERLMRELTGARDSSWFGTLPRPEEVGFLCEVDGRLAGVSWASVVGRHARGHSFMVHPRYRGLGIGTDLLQARMLWLQGRGVVDVVSEIYEGNTASKVAAERAGMAVVGRMFHYRPGPRP